MNAAVDLGLGFDFELFDEASEHTCGSIDTASASPSIISLAVPPLPSSTASPTATPIVGLPAGKLNLKLNASAVASAWNAMAGNAPVFCMPRSTLIAAAVNIPSMEARAQSLAVETQEDWLNDVSRPSSRINSFNKPRTTTVNHVAPSAKISVPRPPRKTANSSQKRRTGGKSSDKRPRIKGRFVRRDELEQFIATTNNKTEDAMVVPEANAAPANNNNMSNTISASLPDFIMTGTMGTEAQRAY
jgi:hypothetical protein